MEGLRASVREVGTTDSGSWAALERCSQPEQKVNALQGLGPTEVCTPPDWGVRVEECLGRTVPPGLGWG